MGKTSKLAAIVDSGLSFAAAIADTKAPPSVTAALCLLKVHYYAFDGQLHQGQLVVHRSLRKELQKIFAIIQARRFPLAGVIPIVHYGWSDEASMAANNSSAFNYRPVVGTTRLSRHAEGLAIDLNPCQNPVVYADGTSLPTGAVYRPGAGGGVLAREGPVVQAFAARGWRWGGDFANLRDYHHFEKDL